MKHKHDWFHAIEYHKIADFCSNGGKLLMILFT